MLANRGGQWPDDSASVNLSQCGAALTAIDHAPYTCLQSDCFDRTTIISSDIDLADRLDSALTRIESAIAARTAAAESADARLLTLKTAAAEAVAALDTLIGDC